MSLARFSFCLCFLLVGLVLANLLFGAASVDLFRVLEPGTDRLILLDIRLPRTCLVVLVGAAVAVSGAVIQGVFRNPLADPALIGVSAGAALFAAAFMVLDLEGSVVGLFGLPGSAFLGGLLTTALVLALGQRGQGAARLLLAGIAINAVALAGVSLFTYLSDDSKLRSVAFWALGSFSGVQWQTAYTGLAMLPFLLFLGLDARRLDIVTLGDAEARHLGLDVQRLRRRLVIVAAVIVGLSVAVAGIISFVGLVVPHLVRLVGFSRHSQLLPLCALLGGCLLLIADLAARTLLAPAELPVGILTALVGGPFFMYLVYRDQQRLTL